VLRGPQRHHRHRGDHPPTATRPETDGLANERSRRYRPIKLIDYFQYNWTAEQDAPKTLIGADTTN
jgi:hypothetical protein